MRVCTLVALVVCLLVDLVASSAHADEATQAALAEKLFRDGRTLLVQGKVREACESFKESKELDPTPGTLINLANCFESLGRTASAWVIYRELETRATRAGQTARANFARQKSAELEPRLAALEIRVPPENRVEDLVVECDETVLGAAALSARVPVDPGPHRIVARAPGRTAWTTSVEAVASAPILVEVPLLAPLSGNSGNETAPARTKSSPLRPLGFGVALAGGLATATGIVFGAFAKLNNDGARRDACGPGGCTADGLARIHRADDLATVSTVTTVSGISLVAIGVALWFLAPSDKTVTRAALLGRLLVVGTF